MADMPWKKILTFSFFVLLSAVFWFLQVYRQDFLATYNIPIKYTEVPDSIIFNAPLPESIEVTVKENGYGIFRYYFTKRKDTLNINVAEVFETSSNFVLSSSALQQVVKNQMLGTSSLVSYNPTYITFQYTALKQKKIPVIFDGQIYLSPGYLLNGDIDTKPDSVIVHGSETVLKNMNYAYTTNDTIHDFSSSENPVYKIKEIENVKFTPNEVEILFPIDKYTQKNITVPITCVNLPENLNVKFFPSAVKISFLVGLSNYQKISENDFSVQFDYNDLKNVRDLLIPLRITSSPDHVQNLAMSPTEAEFIFEQK